MLYQLRLREGTTPSFLPVDLDENTEVRIINAAVHVTDAGSTDVEYVTVDIFNAQNHQGNSLRSNLGTDGKLFLPTFGAARHHWEGISWLLDTHAVSSQTLNVTVGGKTFAGANIAGTVTVYVHLILDIRKLEKIGGRSSATVQNTARMGNNRLLKRPALDEVQDVRAGRAFAAPLRRRTDAVGSFV